MRTTSKARMAAVAFRLEHLANESLWSIAFLFQLNWQKAANPLRPDEEQHF